MKRFRVTVEAVSSTLHGLDIEVAGSYWFTCNTEQMALDHFHATVPIKMLEDFEIEVLEEPEFRCPDCGTEAIEEAEGQTCGTCRRGVIAAMTTHDDDPNGPKRRQEAIDKIECLYPPDSEYGGTRAHGREDMIAALSAEWRSLPVPVLEYMAVLQHRRDHSI